MERRPSEGGRHQVRPGAARHLGRDGRAATIARAIRPTGRRTSGCRPPQGSTRSMKEQQPRRAALPGRERRGNRGASPGYPTVIVPFGLVPNVPFASGTARAGLPGRLRRQAGALRRQLHGPGLQRAPAHRAGLRLRAGHEAARASALDPVAPNAGLTTSVAGRIVPSILSAELPHNLALGSGRERWSLLDPNSRGVSGGRLMHERQSSARVAALALAALWSLSPPALRAQAVSGTILGEVKDATGAVVSGATVVLVNTGTGLTRTVGHRMPRESTRAPSLPTGTYNVSAEHGGVQEGHAWPTSIWAWTRRCASTSSSSVGELTESVEIQAETPLLQTSSSDLSATVESKQIETLPLNGRNFVSLTRTIPGRDARASPAATSTARAAWPGAPRPPSPRTASAPATTTSCSTGSTTTRPGSSRW